MSNALTSVHQKLYRTCFELSFLPSVHVQQVRCKSIASAIKGGLVREGKPVARKQELGGAERTRRDSDDWRQSQVDRHVERRQRPSFRREALPTASQEKPSFVSREQPPYVRGERGSLDRRGRHSESRAEKRSSGDSKRRFSRSEANHNFERSNGSVHKYETSEGYGRASDRSGRFERSSRQRDMPTRLARDEELMGSGDRSVESSRAYSAGSMFLKRENKFDERRDRNDHGRTHRDVRRSFHEKKPERGSPSSATVRLDTKDTKLAKLAKLAAERERTVSKYRNNETGQSEFSGNAWEVPQSVNDVRTLLNGLQGLTIGQYRVGAEILEKAMRERLQDGQPRGSVQGIEILLKNLDQTWQDSKQDTAEVTDESTAKRKLQLEYEMQRLLSRLPQHDASRERWSRWILTSQLKRREVPLRIFSHGESPINAVAPTVEKIRENLVAIMQKLVQELPETDRDKSNYASHLKHHFRLQEKGESLNTVDIDESAGRQSGKTTRRELANQSIGTDTSVPAESLAAEIRSAKLAAQNDVVSKQVMPETHVDNTNVERSNTDMRYPQDGRLDRRLESTQRRKSAFSSSTSRNDATTESSMTPKTDTDADIPVSVPYAAAASTFLYGNNVVLAALRAKRRKLYQLYTTEYDVRHIRDKGYGAPVSDGGIGSIISIAKAAGLPINFNTPVKLLDKLSESRPHNGVVLEASYIPSSPVLSMGMPDATSNTIPLVLNHQSAEEADVNGTALSLPCVSPGDGGRHPVVVLLDGITDPGNLGNILRSAHFYGVDAVAIATNTCASLNLATLAKASSGACEAVPILSLPKPANFVAEAGKAGWKIYAAMAPPSGLIGDRTPPSIRRVTTSDLGNPLQKKPSLLMLGAEGEGLRPNLSNKANFWLSIEQSLSGRSGATTATDIGVESLNVGVAAGVLLERLLRPIAAATTNTTGTSNTTPSTSPATTAKEEPSQDAAAVSEFGIPGGLGF